MRGIHRLSATTVENIKRPGMYADGGGLYLQVGKTGTKSWIFRYQIDGRQREMGLGSYDGTTVAEDRVQIIERQASALREARKAIARGVLETDRAAVIGLIDAALTGPEKMPKGASLKEARNRASAARGLREKGEDPIDVRRAEELAAKTAAALAITFRSAAERYIASHRAAWKNAKHSDQWSATLEAYVYPLIGEVAVGAVDTGLVLKVLEAPVSRGKPADGAKREAERFWTALPETASRVRGRIETILDWARVRGYRSGENPARWRGHLDKLLPSRTRVRGVKHHAALPFDDLPGFMPALRAREGVAQQALEFAILTAARTGEVIGATWDEIDLSAKVWTVPAERMKAKREHRVPLSARAIALLGELKFAAPGGYLFPGGRKGEPLSNMALLETLRRMGRSDLTTHGFRSTFRDWAAERTSYPGDLVEMALAHTISNKVEAAYRRGDLFEKRRRLMEAWSKFCSSPPRVAEDNVTPFDRAAGA